MTSSEIHRLVARVAGSMSLGIQRSKVNKDLVHEWVVDLERAAAALKEKIPAQ